MFPNMSIVNFSKSRIFIPFILDVSVDAYVLLVLVQNYIIQGSQTVEINNFFAVYIGISLIYLLFAILWFVFVATPTADSIVLNIAFLLVCFFISFWVIKTYYLFFFVTNPVSNYYLILYSLGMTIVTIVIGKASKLQPIPMQVVTVYHLFIISVLSVLFFENIIDSLFEDTGGFYVDFNNYIYFVLPFLIFAHIFYAGVQFAKENAFITDYLAKSLLMIMSFLMLYAAIIIKTQTLLFKVLFLGFPFVLLYVILVKYK